MFVLGTDDERLHREIPLRLEGLAGSSGCVTEIMFSLHSSV